MRYLWYIYNKFTNEVEMSFITETDCKKYLDDYYMTRDCTGERIYTYSCIDSFSAVEVFLDYIDRLDDILRVHSELELYER